MKTFAHSQRHSRRDAGSRVLVILVFLSLMAAIIASNNVALHYLDKRLRLVEQRQLKKFK